MVSSKVSFQEAKAAVELHGSNRKAAAALGVGETTVRRALARGPGSEPEEDLVLDPGHHLVRRSRYRRTAEGGEWLISEKVGPSDPASIRELFEDMAKELVTALAPSMPPVTRRVDNVLNLYTITDFHFGALALKREGGADWNMKVALETLKRVYGQMLRQAPDAETAVIAQLGDFLHFDGFDAVTPTNKHLLDASTTYTEMSRVAVHALVWMIQEALKKHNHVHVICAEGNHDIASSQMMRTWLKVLFEDEPRVTIEDSDLPYYAFQWGKTGLVFHHGHLCKPEKLAQVAAATFREMWGQCPFMYGHMGDKHHFLQGRDENGMLVTQHATLAARDRYASRHAWFAMRAAYCHSYTKEYGEAGYLRVTPEMVGLS